MHLAHQFTYLHGTEEIDIRFFLMFWQIFRLLFIGSSLIYALILFVSWNCPSHFQMHLKNIDLVKQILVYRSEV